jgi:hypothetical protein
MTFLEQQLAKLKAAGKVVPAATGATITPEGSSLPHVRRYTAFGILGGLRYPIGWGLNALEAEMIIASARRRLIKSGIMDEDGKRLFEITMFDMREETC